jgi:hypothetical protein
MNADRPVCSFYPAVSRVRLFQKELQKHNLALLLHRALRDIEDDWSHGPRLRGRIKLRWGSPLLGLGPALGREHFLCLPPQCNEFWATSHHQLIQFVSLIYKFASELFR